MEEGAFVGWAKLRDLATGQERSLFRVSGESSVEMSAYSPMTVSPDRRNIAFARGADLMVSPVDGGEPRAVAKSEYFSLDSPVLWAPDGRSLLAIAQEPVTGPERIWKLRRFPLDGGAPLDLGLPALRWGSWFAWHPGGRHVAFDRQESQGELWVIKNLLPAMAASKK